jgi:hypothetical protein
MINNLTNSLYELVSTKIKNIPFMETAIRGDFNRYKELFNNITEGPIARKDLDLITEDNKEIHVHFDDNRDISIEIYDDSNFYNHLSLYITEKRNRVEFVARNVLEKGKIINHKEESEYIYEPDTGNSYIYYSKVNYVTNEETMIIHVYDRKGIEQRRSITHGSFGNQKTKIKNLNNI